MTRLNLKNVSYWNHLISIEGLELWHELTGEEFVIEDGHIVARGKEEPND